MTTMTTLTKDEREFLNTLPEHLHDAGRAYLICVGYTDPETFDDAYAGEWDSFTEYAEELAEDTGMLAEVPEWARPYFDMDKFAHDLTFDHATEAAPDGGVFVFRSI